jgi:hypothetical protein
VTARTSISALSAITTVVTADVVGAIRCDPSVLVFAEVRPGLRQDRSVALSVPADRDVDVSKIVLRCEPSYITAAFGGTTRGRATITSTLSPPEPFPRFARGTIVGEKDGLEVFRIPVLAVRQATRPAEASRPPSEIRGRGSLPQRPAVESVPRRDERADEPVRRPAGI